MSKKFDKIINKMKEEAREDLAFNNMLIAQREVLAKVAMTLIKLQRDIPEETYIKEYIRGAEINLSQAISEYNEGLQEFKEEYK